MINELIQKPHPAKAILINEFKMPLTSIARYLGITYQYTSIILSGLVVTKKHDKKLWGLVEELKKEEEVKKSE